MFICHVALQGCLTLDDVPYGITADTGGHIKYLLELASHSARDPAVERVDLVTRGFCDGKLGARFASGYGERSGKLRLVRLADADPAYLPKERLFEQHEALVDAFLGYLDGLERLPDLIHAHYADAGVLARAAQERRGIPYIFTGHSLGAVKRQANGATDEGLERRIATEEHALARADAVITSSRDEAEAQYAHYRSIKAGRIRVIPPGCELSRFEGGQPSDKVRAAIAQFLRDPAKPIMLAIARPVHKKNLVGLVEAYAADPALQAMANLVIVAGCRDQLDALEPECREVCEALLRAVDAHDLYGRVAYPKTHDPEDIPSYYALARESGGVFVNPALNEPFGLTLLEAAAARLPVVATDSGGPNDIIERCRNGLLVCPKNPEAIAQACRTIIGDRRRWIRFASAGATAVAAYDWKAHCAVYHRLVRSLVAEQRPALRWERMLTCDIDNTLLGDRAALQDFLHWQRERRETIALGIATGRSFHSAQSILASEGVPDPDVVISSVGTRVHWYDRARRCFVEDEAWTARVTRGWDDAAIHATAARLGLRPQGPLEQSAGKASFFLDDMDPALLAQRFGEAGLFVEIVSSHGKYLDVLPQGIGKHAAVLYVGERLGLTQARIVVAGDSGNDRTMLRACPHPIVVGNWSDGLGDDPALSHAYIASATHAGGVLEGVRHFEASGTW
ncbi:glycosyltransferase [Erythrobacter arachoides]|uniref:sucrose-phosphate synthase n=1 Tax=Aurantiacibacter arachoides TaxID=1850444 RepID=A0A845A1E9_9SPHN|nr:HAD family hydrolase [Aurantiacibacter arachoides]MXO94363.1 glycosyltransferase [Aurantiacibacter arachoides]GGD64043.1 sucrose-phosphate synthase [Aurantiacibacter arachoides]